MLKLLFLVAAAILVQCACSPSQKISKRTIEEDRLKPLLRKNFQTDTSYTYSYQEISNPHPSVEYIKIGLKKRDQKHSFIISFYEDSAVNEQDVWEIVNPLIGFNAIDEKLIFRDSIKLSHSKIRNSYGITYKEIPLQNCSITTTLLNESIIQVHGKYYKDLDFDLSSLITEKKVLEIAKKRMPPRTCKYCWDDTKMQKIKDWTPKFNLIIQNAYSMKDHRREIALVYGVNLCGGLGMSDAFVYINAITGEFYNFQSSALNDQNFMLKVKIIWD